MATVCDEHNYCYSDDGFCPYCEEAAEDSAKQLEIIEKAAEIVQRKRDRFELAKAAMQGLLAKEYKGYALNDLEVVKKSIGLADNMLFALKAEDSQ